MKSRGIVNYLKDSLYLFLLLCLVFFPFTLHIFPVWYTNAILGKLVIAIARLIPGLTLHNPAITSDSSSMYVLTAMLLVKALILSGVLHCIGKWGTWREKFIVYARTIMTYYLAMILLKYGFDKLFKQQFYLPEPNILYTNLGQLHRDLAYWSVIGTSRAYSIFLGLCEIIPALMIFSRKLRGPGFLFSTLVLINIVAVNFGFDISVKLYSIFLLATSLTLGYPYFLNYYKIIINRINTELNCGKLELKNRRLYLFLKVFVIGLVFIEALYPYVNAGNYNDDNAQRPLLHGAYRVEGFAIDGDTTAIEGKPTMLFIHRRGYLILKFGDDQFKDYAMKLDMVNHTMTLTDYRGEIFYSEYTINNDRLRVDIAIDRWHSIWAKAVDWKKLPLLKNEFHWTVDGIESGENN